MKKLGCGFCFSFFSFLLQTFLESWCGAGTGANTDLGIMPLPTCLPIPGAGSSRQSSWKSRLFPLTPSRAWEKKKGNILFSVDLSINCIHSQEGDSVELPLPSLCSEHIFGKMDPGDATTGPDHHGHVVHEPRCAPCCGEVFPRKHWHTGNYACQEGLEQNKEPKNETKMSHWLGFPSDPQKRWCQQ